MESIFGKKQENNGVVTIEEIENAFKQPTQRQDYYEQPAAAPGEAIPADLLNPDGPEPTDNLLIDEPKEISPEKAKRTGERIARLADTGIDFVLSNFVAHNDETYRADERDLDDIAECWGEIAQEHDWNIGPEWQLAILYIMVYGPLVKQAMTDRRIVLIEASQREIEQRLSILENQNDDNDGNQKPTAKPFAHRIGNESGSEAQG